MKIKDTDLYEQKEIKFNIYKMYKYGFRNAINNENIYPI